jgi:hypothetical protein
LKLPTFENKISRWICTNYFHHQEHFSLENFINQLISNPLLCDNEDLLHDAPNTPLQKPKNMPITTKVMIFTRTSSYILGLNMQTKNQLFGEDDSNNLDSHNGRIDNITEKVDILNMVCSYATIIWDY